mmetsp:Transcript_31801/g.80067  ORF Transcript_31801/g.80067 Transcript_31801/m.80067 type:complete len:209 (+) Transcript_31801:917-1543(+)
MYKTTCISTRQNCLSPQRVCRSVSAGEAVAHSPPRQAEQHSEHHSPPHQAAYRGGACAGRLAALLRALRFSLMSSDVGRSPLTARSTKILNSSKSMTPLLSVSSWPIMNAIDPSARSKPSCFIATSSSYCSSVPLPSLSISINSFLATDIIACMLTALDDCPVFPPKSFPSIESFPTALSMLLPKAAIPCNPRISLFALMNFFLFSSI